MGSWTRLSRLQRAALSYAIAFASTLLVLTACGEGSTEATPPKAIVTAAATSVELVPGSSKFIVYSIERTAGHSGDVNFSVSGLPAGVTATFHPPVVKNGVLVSNLQITAAPLANPGNYTFTTTASGNGVEASPIEVTVKVTVPFIEMSVATAALSMEQAATTATTVTVTRSTGFTGVVGLSAIGLPVGVTATFSPAVLEEGQSTATLTLTSTITAVLGSKAITVRATASGVEPRSSPVQLTVLPTTTPAILVDVAPPFLQVIAGNSISTTVNITRIAGFNGDVSFVFENLPSDVTATIPAIASGATSTTLTFDVGLSTAIATHQLRVQATGTGLSRVEAGVALQVLEVPGFRFSFHMPDPVTGVLVPSPTYGFTMARGTSRPTLMNFARITGFSETVVATLHNIPAGVVINNFPMTFTGTSSASGILLQWTVTEAAAPGVHVMTLRGTATGGKVVETTITLTIT